MHWPQNGDDSRYSYIRAMRGSSTSFVLPGSEAKPRDFDVLQGFEGGMYPCARPAGRFQKEPGLPALRQLLLEPLLTWSHDAMSPLREGSGFRVESICPDP